MTADFSVGLSALQAARTGLDVVAQNVANANTPGYHRQITRLVDKMPVELRGFFIGTGVEVGHIDRARQIRNEGRRTSR